MSMNKALIRDPIGGRNQTGLRDQNARLVLSFIRRHGAMSSAEIARRSGLSAQTVSNIIRALEAEGLLTRGEAVKGKVGKPSIPMTLNPWGVTSLGLNIGRRSAELVLVDFRGKVLETITTIYPYPEIDGVFGFLRQGMADLFKRFPRAKSSVTGIGVARPNEIWNWLEIVGAPEAALRKWRDLDLAAAVRAETGLDVAVENDATSACVAEHLVGRGSEFSDFAYVFVGAFVGAGLVLDGKLFWGATGRAATLGTLPVPDGSGGTTPLLNTASLFLLENDLKAAGQTPEMLRSDDGDWAQFEPWVAPWVDRSGDYLAIASAAIASIVEVEAILIDGAMPRQVLSRLTDRTREQLAQIDLTGIDRPKIETAQVGRTARSVGAALLPIHSKYFLA